MQQEQSFIIRQKEEPVLQRNFDILSYIILFVSREIERSVFPNLPEDNLKISFFLKESTSDEVFMAIDIPKEFSTGAIKEILSQLVWGFNPRRAIAFVPEESADVQVLASEELVRLRSISKQDRFALLDMYAMRIKSSEAAVIVERIR